MKGMLQRSTEAPDSIAPTLQETHPGSKQPGCIENRGIFRTTHLRPPAYMLSSVLQVNKSLLVILNLSKESIQDYRFCLSESEFTAGTAEEILLGIDVENPTINNDGGFDSYQPVQVLDPYETYIIELK